MGDFLTFANRKNTLSLKEKEAINLAVSQVNGCNYCLRGHTVMARQAGFSDEQIIGIRKGKVTFSASLNALVQFAQATTLQRGRPAGSVIDNFFAAGYTEASLIDAILTIAGKTVTNYLHNITQVPIDWPEIPEI